MRGGEGKKKGGRKEEERRKEREKKKRITYPHTQAEIALYAIR